MRLVFRSRHTFQRWCWFGLSRLFQMCFFKGLHWYGTWDCFFAVDTLSKDGVALAYTFFTLVLDMRLVFHSRHTFQRWYQFCLSKLFQMCFLKGLHWYGTGDWFFAVDTLSKDGVETLSVFWRRSEPLAQTVDVEHCATIAVSSRRFTFLKKTQLRVQNWMHLISKHFSNSDFE